MPASEAYNMDCMEYMKSLPDKAFDLLIADPPYRDMKENQPTKDMRRNGTMERFGNKPSAKMLAEMFRISKEQIIFGANNFELPPYKGFIVWRKKTISEDFTMSMAEIAYISKGLGTVSKVYECQPQGRVGDPRIHPTQKPIELYSWIFSQYAKRGWRIIDPFLGSGSSRIATYDAGLDFVGCEVDKTYFDLQEERFERHTAQMSFWE